jgi:hypothetical protein
MLLKFAEFKQLNEGHATDVLKLSVDYLYAFRLAKILFQKWESTDAFRLGLINADGKKLRAASTLEERASYTPFIALAFNIKRLLGKVPGGDTKVAAIAASYMMMKEYAVYEDGILPEVLDEVFERTLQDLGYLIEDAPVMTTAALPSQPMPIGLKRKNWKDMPKFAGKHSFQVSSDLFDRVKSAKIKGEKWDQFIKPEDGEVGEDIKKFAKTYPQKPIVLKRANLDVFTHLKN